jgi:bloom syndrome protein
MIQKIANINMERVQTFGQPFVALVTKYKQHYDQAMSGQDDRVIDKHENVIDLVSDEEGEEEDYGLDDEDDETAILEAEQGSKYFVKPQHGPNPKSGNVSGRNLPWAAGNDGKSSSSQGRGSSYRVKGRGGKRPFSRKSNGSNSGQSSSGVSKRRISGGAKKTRASKSRGNGSSRGSALARSFSNNGGGCMGGDGIGMMPTNF